MSEIRSQRWASGNRPTKAAANVLSAPERASIEAAATVARTRPAALATSQSKRAEQPARQGLDEAGAEGS